MAVRDGIVGKLTEEQARTAIAAAIRAPSLHNTQPWRFHLDSHGIELHADRRRALPVTDPDHRELLLSCGAALLNLRLAIRAQHVLPEVWLLPEPGRPDLLAVVRPGRTKAATAQEIRLAGAIDRRHTNRHPFVPSMVSVPVRNELRRATELELAWLATLHGPQLPALRSLVHGAHQAQSRDANFLAEWGHWVARNAEDVDGVPRENAGPRPETGDAWVLRDFAAGRAAIRPPGIAFEPDPLIVVVGSKTDTPLAWLHAGQAMQRLLLTATTAGLASSFLSQVVEVPVFRERLRTLLGDRLWPQVVLRLGYGIWTVPVTPRRPLDEVVGEVVGEVDSPVADHPLPTG